MQPWVHNTLLALQLTLFVFARIVDDVSWYQVDIENEQNVLQGLAVATLSTAIILNFIRKWQINGILKIMLLRSQSKFFISWSLDILIVILFINTFGCQHQMHEGDSHAFFMYYQSCVLNCAQILLTNLNFSFALNTKTHLAELIVYQIVLFAQIIFDARVFIGFVHKLDFRQKDLSLLYMTIVIANQILIMDLIFRAAYEEKNLELLGQKLGKEILLVNDNVVFYKNNKQDHTPQAIAQQN